MSDDWNSFICVSILFTIMIIYCNYINNLSIVKHDWSNYKCNPLYMLINSVVSNSEDSIDNFKKCVNMASYS